MPATQTGLIRKGNHSFQKRLASFACTLGLNARRGDSSLALSSMRRSWAVRMLFFINAVDAVISTALCSLHQVLGADLNPSHSLQAKARGVLWVFLRLKERR